MFQRYFPRQDKSSSHCNTVQFSAGSLQLEHMRPRRGTHGPYGEPIINGAYSGFAGFGCEGGGCGGGSCGGGGCGGCGGYDKEPAPPKKCDKKKAFFPKAVAKTLATPQVAPKSALKGILKSPVVKDAEVKGASPQGTQQNGAQQKGAQAKGVSWVSLAQQKELEQARLAAQRARARNLSRSTSVATPASAKPPSSFKAPVAKHWFASVCGL